MERVCKGLVLGYFAVLLAVAAPRVADPYISLGGMVNWLGPVRHAQAAPGAAEHSHFRRGVGIRSSVLGYNLLLRFWRWTGEPVRLAKACSWVLLGVALVFLFGLARELGGPAAGLLACVLFLHMPAHRDNMGGIPPAFAWPLLLSFLYYLHRKRRRAALICLGLCGLFYPPLVPGCAALYVLRRVQRDPDSGHLSVSLRDRWLWALAAVVLGIFVLVAPWSMLLGDGDRPQLATYTERLARDAALQNQLALIPEDGPGQEEYHWMQRHWAGHFIGALGQPFQVRGFSVWGDEVPFSWRARYGPGLLLLAFLALVAFVGVRRAAPPRLVTELLLTSTGLYIVAMLVAFLLYYPERYVEYTLPVASILLVSVVVIRALERLPPAARRLAPVAFCLVYLTGWGSGVDLDMGPEDDFREARGVLQYLGQKVPADALVASPLYLGDAVELMADRESFLFCQEVTSLSHLLSGQDYRGVIRRMTYLHQAYFAATSASVLAFMERFEVDYLVARQAHFLPALMDDPASTLCPHEIAPARAASAGRRGSFFLAVAPAAVKVYSDDNGYFVISRDKLRAHQNKKASGRR